jgi:SAM-dependent methyltransferase
MDIEEHLHALRRAEIEIAASFMKPAGARILEIGAGTGLQARLLADKGFAVSAIDIPSSNYAARRVHPVLDYDGRRIPFADASFDVVFSSNVLEHVSDLTGMHSEIRRVLAPGGYCVHVMPTAAWRFWTSVSYFPHSARNLWRKRRQIASAKGRRNLVYTLVEPFLYQRRHGERGNIFTELWYFRPQWWRANFRRNGFSLVEDRPLRLFYTGNQVCAGDLPMGGRRLAARLFGSATHLFVVTPDPRQNDGR